MIESLALHEFQEEQQHKRPDKCANKFAELTRRAQPEEAKEKSAQQRADDAYDNVPHDAEAVTFDDNSRQKPGGQSDESEPNPVFHMPANVASPRGKATLTLQNPHHPPLASITTKAHPTLRISEA